MDIKAAKRTAHTRWSNRLTSVSIDAGKNFKNFCHSRIEDWKIVIFFILYVWFYSSFRICFQPLITAKWVWLSDNRIKQESRWPTAKGFQSMMTQSNRIVSEEQHSKIHFTSLIFKIAKNNKKVKILGNKPFQLSSCIQRKQNKKYVSVAFKNEVEEHLWSGLNFTT